MKKVKITSGMLLVATALLISSCSSTPGETSTTGENASETSFNLFKAMTEVRASENPQTAFNALKTEYLKADNPLTLQFVVDYINDKQVDKPQVDLKLVDQDQVTVSNDPIMMSSISCSAEDVKRMPRKIHAGLNYILKSSYTPVVLLTPEFLQKIKTFNKQFGYDVIDPSGPIENEIGYILVGNHKLWDQSDLYSEADFENAKFSDQKESKKIEFYVQELENGSLKELLTAYKAGQIAMIDYAAASEKNALDPQTVVTVNGAVTTADFQYPLTDNKNQPYGKLIIGFDGNCKITDIKPQNKNFLSLVQSSNTTGDGIAAIKKKIDFYAKNKPTNDPNSESQNDESWSESLNK